MKTTKIQLTKAWLVSGSNMIEGFGFELETLYDGSVTRSHKKYFTKDGINFTEANWIDKVFFDKSHALIAQEDNKKERIKYAKEKLAYYTKVLRDIENEGNNS